MKWGKYLFLTHVLYYLKFFRHFGHAILGQETPSAVCGPWRHYIYFSINEEEIFQGEINQKDILTKKKLDIK